MKKNFYILLLLFVLVANLSAQKVSVDVIEQNLRKHVGYLASDRLEGRRTGEKGAVYAAGYVANWFANFKLKAGYVKNGKTKFLQPFPYTSGIALGKNNSMRLLPEGKSSLEPKMEMSLNWMPVGFSASGEIPLTQIVFANFGIVSEDIKLNDYKDIDVKDRIVLVYDGAPRSEWSRFADVRLKAKIAKDRGAKALLIVSNQQKLENDKLSSLKFEQTLGETAIPTALITRGEGLSLIDSNRPKSAAQLQIDLVKKTTNAYNVIGVLEGTDPVLRNEAIVIGAHYDHLGRGGAGSLAPNSTDIHRGADDNASGTSALIELANQFAKAKNNKRTLIFISFGGEEEGLLGSKYYVNNPVFLLNKTIAMINMDMIGRLRDNKLNIGGIGTATEWKSLVESKNPAKINPPASDEKVSLPILPNFILQLTEDGFGPSDHASFYGKQIPVLFFFTGTHLDYHKPSDSAEKINYWGLKQIYSYVSEIVRAVDQNPVKPTYVVAKSSAIDAGRRGFSVSLGTIPSYSDANDGLLIDGVRDNSPAAKTGLKAGDKIIKIAGKDIRNISDYTIILGDLKPDTEYEIVYLRGTSKIIGKIIPAARK